MPCPGAPAVIENGVVTTWGELEAAVERIAAGLATLGLRAGDRAVWCGPNSTEVVVLIHAFRRLGLVSVPMPYRLTAGEAAHVLADSGAVAAVVDPAYAALAPGALTFEEVAEAGAGSHPPAAAGDGATMLYTSGTTGRPKGAVRRPSDPALTAALLAELGFAPGEVHLVTGPLYHAGPHAFALLTHRIGGTLVVSRRFDAGQWAGLAARHEVTSAFVAPIHLKRIVALPGDVELPSMRALVVNAAPVPYALKREVIARLGEGFLYEVYGSTELGIATVLRPQDQLRKPGSCGRPYGGVGLRVVDEDGRDVPAGVAGELFIRSANAMAGYHRSTQQLAELPGGWKSVGDEAWLDGEGYLHICDRRTDMVITGGMNVYPAEVEAALQAHADVADAAVFGVADEEWGERVHAVVVPRPGAEVDSGALEAFLAEQLAGFKRPRSWSFRDELPRTESGKLLKRVLRAEHEAREPART
ncbi:MAG TPA: AMP-binding protein [Acidimicrobiales bacterium]|nr:AMP-binding protein [Acidimicrobiales bacterium]